MKNVLLTSGRCGGAYILLIILALMLSSIVLTVFHSHQCHETESNCIICSFHSSYSAVEVSIKTNHAVSFKPISDFAITLNEKATDPSQRRVCSSHAPPQSC